MDRSPFPTPPSRCKQCPVYGRNFVWGCRWSYQNATQHHEEGILCIICTEALSDTIKWCRSSSADTDAQNGGPPLEPGDLCRELIANDHRYYMNVVK